jgi:hypothetical protein
VTIEDSSEEIDATDDEPTVEDELDEVEAIMAETEADETAEDAPPPIEALDHIQNQVIELSGIIARQSQRIERISKLLLDQASQLQAISRNLRRIDGERVVTERVPLTSTRPEDGLEPISPQAPPDDFVPPLHGYDRQDRQGRVGMRHFSSVIDGDPPDLELASDSPNSIAEKAAKRRVTRNRKYRMGTRS